ncbi:MAG TPA: hypothetical protein PL089_11520 [Ignavibacteria bacterium]|nr:hypothetical protein [Ignavibacteria bacterium]
MKNNHKYFIVSFLLISFLMVSGGEFFHHHGSAETNGHDNCSVCIIHSQNTGIIESSEICILEIQSDEVIEYNSESHFTSTLTTSVSDRAPPK